MRGSRSRLPRWKGFVQKNALVSTGRSCSSEETGQPFSENTGRYRSSSTSHTSCDKHEGALVQMSSISTCSSAGDGDANWDILNWKGCGVGWAILSPKACPRVLAGICRGITAVAPTLGLRNARVLFDEASTKWVWDHRNRQNVTDSTTGVNVEFRML